MQKNILVVDDEADVRKLISTAMILDGHEVFEAGDGRSAVDMAFEIEPDLIILDVMMPRMDGFEALSLLRHHRKTRKTPVILLTAKTSEPDRIEGLSLGADDYLAKPFSLEELRLRVDRRLQASEELARLTAMAWSDPVTDLGNRRSFGDAYDRWWEEHRKYGSAMAIICIFVDGLEIHLRSQTVFASDALLRRIGVAIRTELEEREQAFGLSAHRFAVLTPHSGQLLVARELRLSHAVERVILASAFGYGATVRSTSASPFYGESSEAFLKRALSRSPTLHTLAPRGAGGAVDRDQSGLSSMSL